jgi:DNA polymerase-3 subunit epsilon
VDTVQLARRKIPPGASASLDALCTRFGIDISGRAQHGALKDALLLAEVYLELIGGRQPGLVFAQATAARRTAPARTGIPPGASSMRAARAHAPTDGEAAAHAAFIAKLKDPVWGR